MKLFKKFCYILAIIATVTIGLSSCSDDMTPDSPKYEGEVDVIMTTSIPSDLTTYADEDGNTSSKKGGIQNLANKGFSVRFIMEVYPKGSDKLVARKINYNPINDDLDAARSTSFSTRLTAAEYNFVFYADIVREINLNGGLPIGITSNTCYGNRYFFSNTTNNLEDKIDVLVQPKYMEDPVEGSLKSIRATRNADYNYNHTSLEQYDIYTCKEVVNLRDEASHSFTLKRPFAKVRLVTTDVNELEEDKIPDWNLTAVSLNSSNSEEDLNNEYNAVDDSFSYTDRGYWMSFYQTTKEGSNNTLNTDIYEDEEVNGEHYGERTLAVFYLPVSNGSYNLNLAISTHKGSISNKIIDNFSISADNVPLAPNKLTTIRGNLLTQRFVSTITIDDDFELFENFDLPSEVNNASEVQGALSGNTQTITVLNKVTKEDGLSINFTTLTRSEPEYKYDVNNSSVLTLNLPNVEAGAVISIKGGLNAPKQIIVNNGGKCSILIDSEYSETVLAGSDYGYLVYNKKISYQNAKNKPNVDAFLIVDNGTGLQYPKNSDYHRILLNTDFNLKEPAECKKHTENCSLISTIQSWQASNSGKTVWDFVEANK